MPNMRDHDASIYFKLQGDTLQIGNTEPRNRIVNPVNTHWKQRAHTGPIECTLNGSTHGIPRLYECIFVTCSNLCIILRDLYAICSVPTCDFDLHTSYSPTSCVLSRWLRTVPGVSGQRRSGFCVLPLRVGLGRLWGAHRGRYASSACSRTNRSVQAE